MPDIMSMMGHNDVQSTMRYMAVPKERPAREDGEGKFAVA